jgi:hypothetical protein
VCIWTQMQKHNSHCQDEYDFTNTPVMEAGRGAGSVLQQHISCCRQCNQDALAWYHWSALLICVLAAC